MFAEERSIRCPFCGEAITIVVDPSVVPQHYVEDCEVCCRPMEISVSRGDDGRLKVVARDEDETGAL